MSIQWEDKFSLHISGVDDQHKRIFFLLEQSERLFIENKDNLFAHIEKIKGTLLELEQYSITHFLMEERAMEDSSYPNFESHKNLHIKFTNEIQEFINNLKKEETLKDEKRLNAFLEKMIHFITSWIKNHIQVKDIEIKEYVKSL